MTRVRTHYPGTLNGVLGPRSRRTTFFRLGACLTLQAVSICLVLAPPTFAQDAGPVSIAPRPPLKPQPDGSIVVPSSDKTGKRTEGMILMPITVQARSIPLPTTPATNPTPAPPAITPKYPFEESVLALQVALARQGMSPGSFDGVAGPQTRGAIRAFQLKARLPITGTADAETRARLEPDGPLFTNYIVTAEDLACLQPLGQGWLAKSQQESLAYETILELVAEKTCSNPKLLRSLNPDVVWTNISAGTSLKTVHAPPPGTDEKAAFLRIYLGERKLHAYGANSNLLVHFPCSIAARVDKRPLGEELHIAAIAPNPNYTFDPAVFPESEEARQLGRKLLLQPGPNNPVGTVWLSLDKPGYGIHGTPKPEEVGRTESHGCFRLANWNVEYLLKLIALGTPVFVEP